MLASRRPTCDRPRMSARGSLASLVLLAVLSLSTGGCGGPKAYIDWRPGLRANDFDGTFEIALSEFEGFAERGEQHTLYERRHGNSLAAAEPALTAIGARLAAADRSDARGYAVVGLTGDGKLQLLEDRGAQIDGTLDWFATTPDHEWAALLSDTKLAVVIGSSSAGVDIGTLLGGSDGYHFMMLVEGDELTVFALPEMGNVVAANEVGFILSFRYLSPHGAGAREPWDITVARVVVTM